MLLVGCVEVEGRGLVEEGRSPFTYTYTLVCESSNNNYSPNYYYRTTSTPITQQLPSHWTHPIAQKKAHSTEIIVHPLDSFHLPLHHPHQSSNEPYKNFGKPSHNSTSTIITSVIVVGSKQIIVMWKPQSTEIMMDPSDE